MADGKSKADAALETRLENSYGRFDCPFLNLLSEPPMFIDSLTRPVKFLSVF